MTFPTWFFELLSDEVRTSESEAAFDGHIWRYHRSADDHFFAEYLPQPFLDDLQNAGRDGWKTVVERNLDSLDPATREFTHDYFFESYRSDFVERLGLKEGARVLDLGCGWGFASQRALQKGACVVSCEVAVQRLRFCAARFEQEGFGDRFVGVELDVNKGLPFRAGAFDAIIVSGLMEWLPCSTQGDPDEIQAAFLQQMNGLLKAGGCLYVAIENRYWGPYFRGARDEHTFQRFVSIAPRSLARAWSKSRTGNDYRAFCHGLPTYANMMARAGFASLDAQVAKPGYNRPKEVVPVVSGFALNRSPRALSRALWARNRARLDSLFAHSFLLFARKKAGGEGAANANA